jgi:hypothetical protein
LPKADANANFGEGWVKSRQGSDFLFVGCIPDETDDSAKGSGARNEGEDEQPDDGTADLRKAAFESSALLELLGALRLCGRKRRATMTAS